MSEILETAAHWPLLLQILYLLWFLHVAKRSGALLALLLFGACILAQLALFRFVLPVPAAWVGRLWLNLIPFAMLIGVIFGVLPKLQFSDGIWRFRNCRAPLALFAASCLLQHAALVLLGFARYALPDAVQPYITPLLWSQYTLAPVFWICCHALTALLLWLDNAISRRSGIFSGSSLLAALLFAMLLQTAYILHGLIFAAV